MRYRTLGRTGVSVSVLGFGASPLGNVFGAVSPQKALRAVHHALERGVNLFDVSPYYGDGLAEERLGAALAGRRDQVFLATKCGRYGTDRFDFSAAAVARAFEASLHRLRTDYVDLLQVHDVEFGTPQQIVEETLPAMRSLQQQGKVRFLGLTGYWPGLLARLADTSPVDAVLNYCHFNLLMDDMDQVLTPAATRLGMGLLNASPLHMGLLAGATGAPWHPAPVPVQSVAVQIAARIRAHGIVPATLAVYACVQHPSVASTLVGFGNAAQVDEACEALALDPAPELLATVRKLAAPVFNAVWPSGLPANQPPNMAHSSARALSPPVSSARHSADQKEPHA